ncbi:glutathione S-transferase P 1-like [Anomaloglossus baeobatrachus]|uniref:glutathione S-transferase P 1-like n=1 Tax=Anomaloglossus baeobatrachus TaxID=238106 RepID=UPI003F509C0D
MAPHGKAFCEDLKKKLFLSSAYIDAQPFSAPTICYTLHQIGLHGCHLSKKPLLRMMPKKVHKQFAKGRAEGIRLLQADQWVSWADDEMQIANWISGKSDIKKKAVFGQLPRLKHGDFVLYQSNAILRYLGRIYGLSGNNSEESALIDMVNDGVEDLRQKFGYLIFFEYETGKEKYIQDLPNHLSAFERILSNNSNGTKFLVGDKISFADYNLLDTLHCHLDLDPKCLASFPLLSDYEERIASRPKLSQYLKSEKRNKRPITPKHK